MKALVSGQASLAILKDGERVFSLHLDSADPVPRSESDIPYLLADASDVEQLDDVSHDEAVSALELAWSKDRALHLTLILLDGDADGETRRLAAECLEDLLSSESVLEFVSNRFYAALLPQVADLLGALLNAEAAAVSRVRDLLEELGSSQEEIRRHREAWDSLPKELFGGSDARQEFTRTAVTAGAFRKFAEAGSADGDVVLYQCLADPRFQRLNNHRQVLMAWAKPFRKPRITKTAPLKEDEIDESVDSVHRAEVGRPKRGHAVFEAVNRQKESIKRLLSEADVDRALGYVDDLVHYQETRSAPENLARSLCDLAMHAKNVGAHDIQLKLVQRAVDILPGDAWSQAQLGDAYLCLGRYQKALTAYDAAVGYGGRRIGRCGRAEVLRAMGRSDEAVEAYEDAISDFPHETVPRNGLAEVLKAKGRLDEALNAYEAAIGDFPHDVFPRSGRAEVLKAMGHLDQALKEYEAAIADFPHEAVARNGRAGVLKAMGCLDEALQEYDTAIAEFPGEVVPHCGRAEVLKAMGSLDEALQEYDTAIAHSPHDVVPRSGRAEVLKAMGSLDEALQEYDTAIAEFPGEVVPHCGRAEVLKAMGSLDEALQEYDTAIAEFPGEVVPHCGRADVLKAMGRLDEALQEYDTAIAEFPGEAVPRRGRAEVLKAMGSLDKALQEYDIAITHSPHEVVPHCGRAEVLKAMGRLDEALQEYDIAITHSPHEVVPHCGRAEVLKAMGRLDEALQEYDTAIAHSPHDVVPRRGRAEVLKAMGRLDEALQEYDTAIAEFPGEVVPHCGRAEVLKAMGRAHEALREYDTVIGKFPIDRVARSGRASALVMLSRYQAALDLLPVGVPRTLDDWIDSHIRGMISMKQGNLTEAVEIFETGVRESPWALSVSYFRSALAVAKLRAKQHQKALEAIGDEHSTVSDLLRMHAFGELRQIEEVQEALGHVEDNRLPAVVSLRDELAGRYVISKASYQHQPDNWVFEKECELLLAA